ncbi:MAG TPA: HAD-IIA family hydrolase [Acidimicrobiales bacterium]|nr:HAD-IIA family hydrolase [Acidimicrobiales bacterium]
MTVLLDLDGVVWLGPQVIPGSPEAIARLRAAGERVVFFTNNSNPTIPAQLAKLGGMGIDCEASDFLTSGEAAARLLEPGSTALVVGGPGIGEALGERGVKVTFAGEDGAGDPVPDAVVLGLDQRFDYAKLAQAMTAVLKGAALVATNDDATYPSPGGPLPGSGSLVAAVAYATGVKPTVAGKPNRAAADLVAERVGTVSLAVGDRPSTDGALARQLGARFGLVLSGVTPPGHGPVDPEPDLEAADLATLVEEVLTKGSTR